MATMTAEPDRGVKVVVMMEAEQLAASEECHFGDSTQPCCFAPQNHISVSVTSERAKAQQNGNT